MNEYRPRFVPLPSPSKAELATIPLYSEVVVVGDGAICCLLWGPHEQETAVSRLSAEDDRYMEMWFYLPPNRSAQGAIDEVLLDTDLGGRIANIEGLADAIRSGWLDATGLHTVVSRIVEAAQL